MQAAAAQAALWWQIPPSPLAAGTLQGFIDGYLAAHGGTVDYIHGDDVVMELSKKPGAIGFLLPAMEKSQLFPGGARRRRAAAENFFDGTCV